MNPILPFLITKTIYDTTNNTNNSYETSNNKNINDMEIFDNSMYEEGNNKKENDKKEENKKFLTNFTLICYGIGLTIFIITMIITHFIPKSNSYQNTESVANLVIYKLHIAQLTTFGFLIAFIVIYASISIIKKIKKTNKKS